MSEPIPQDEGEKLLAAEMRRRELAAQHKPIEPVKAGDSLEASLERLAKLKIVPPPAVLEQNRANDVLVLKKAANIPDRHKEPIERAQTPWQSTLDKITARMGEGFMIALVGIQGTGKTQMGASTIMAATEKLKACKFSTAMDFFIDLKSSYDDDSKTSEAAALKSYIKPAVLVLDEMDERSESAWENRMLFHMLNKRYNAMKDTLLISRSDRVTFLDSVGKSIQSRLQETGGTIVCDWPSFRTQRKAA